MFDKVTKLALTSRIIVLVIQLIANWAIPDHKPDVFRKPLLNDTQDEVHWLDRVIQSTFGGLRHWDAEYFLHIAEYDYSYENTLAFFPFYPLVLRTCASALHSKIGLVVSLHSCMLVLAVALNIYFFCKATTKLYELTQRVCDDPCRSWNTALLFCINPASIFFTAAYSEALYCWLTFALMHEIVTEQRFLRSTLTLALSIVTRSNGMTNIGFVVYFAIRKMLMQRYHRIWIALKMLLTILCALIPLTFFNFYAFQLYCVPGHKVDMPAEVLAYGKERQYILAGALANNSIISGDNEVKQPSPWCKFSFPFPYSYIQSHYWNVGFLRYYEFKQLPNFILALPILGFVYMNGFMFLMALIVEGMRNAPANSMRLLNIIRTCKGLPFVLHALFLTIICTFFVHIQISTRLLCSATPCLYWFAANYMPKSFGLFKLRSTAGTILLWFGGYYILGTILFANNWPWT